MSKTSPHPDTDGDSQTQAPEHEDAGEEIIRRRAYEISQGLDAGTPEENWARAEREMAGGD